VACTAAAFEPGSGRCLPFGLLYHTQFPAGLLPLSRPQPTSFATDAENPVPTDPDPAVSPSGPTVCRTRLGAGCFHPGFDQSGLRIWSTFVPASAGSLGSTASAGGIWIYNGSLHSLKCGCQLPKSQAASALWHCSPECGPTATPGWSPLCQCAPDNRPYLLWNTADPEALTITNPNPNIA